MKRDAILSVHLCIGDLVREVSFLGMRPALDKWEKGLALVPIRGLDGIKTSERACSFSTLPPLFFLTRE